MQSYADRVDELYHEASGLKAIVYDKDRVQTSPEQKMEKIFAQIDAEAEKYARARLRYEKEVRRRIDQIEAIGGTFAELLILRYIDGKRWEEIACIMHYTFRHITRLHGQALAAFTARFKDVL